MLHFNSATNYSTYNQMNLRKDLKTNTGETKEPEAEKSAKDLKEPVRKVTVGDCDAPGVLIITEDYKNKKDARNSGDLVNGDLVAINGKEFWYINGRFIRNKG